MFKKFFNKQKDFLNIEEYNLALRDNAIEYIKNLDKNEKDKFIDAVGLIWQGYDRLIRVKTKTQKIEEKELKDDKDLGFVES